MLAGAVIAAIAVFPLAAATALLFRFPVPFAGYLSGLEGAKLSPFALYFYGQLGGFPVLILGGAASGYAAHLIGRRAGRRAGALTVALPLAFSFACVLILAVLDRIIGPW